MKLVININYDETSRRSNVPIPCKPRAQVHESGDAILKTFIEAGQHLSAEELYARVKKAYPGIDYATVYRTLKLLAEAGLAEERRFEDGVTLFEYKNTDAHHYHLICTRCGAIIEFENERIEALQHDVARQKGFKVQNHKLELYGLCAACQR